MFYKKLILSSILLVSSHFSSANRLQTIEDIQHAWANANYQTHSDQQEAIFENIIKQTRLIVQQQPDKPEYKVWLAILLSTDAGINGGISALSKVKEARRLLEEAELTNPNILNGSIYTSLGSLYYKVPGWPISFGNDKKAKEYLQKALASNPDGIDSNYFFGDFLIENDKPKQALIYLKKALKAPPRSSRPVADQGRHKEIILAIKKAEELIKMNEEY